MRALTRTQARYPLRVDAAGCAPRVDAARRAFAARVHNASRTPFIAPSVSRETFGALFRARPINKHPREFTRRTNPRTTRCALCVRGQHATQRRPYASRDMWRNCKPKKTFRLYPCKFTMDNILWFPSKGKAELPQSRARRRKAKRQAPQTLSQLLLSLLYWAAKHSSSCCRRKRQARRIPLLAGSSFFVRQKAQAGKRMRGESPQTPTRALRATHSAESAAQNVSRETFARSTRDAPPDIQHSAPCSSRDAQRNTRRPTPHATTATTRLVRHPTTNATPATRFARHPTPNTQY